MSLLSSIAKLAAKAKFKAIDKSPELFFIGGTVGLVATAVSAAKRSLSFQSILEDRREILDELEEEAKTRENYDEHQQKVDKYKVNIATGWRAFLHWLPTFLLGFGSVLLYARGFGILKTWYVSAASACATLATENETLHSIIDGQKAKDAETVGEEIEYDENGAIKQDNCPVDPEDATHWAYARIFDESNPNWEKSAEKNRFWLHQKEAYANFLLKKRGYLFLNEVYELLGFRKEDAGQVLGWVYYENPEEARFHGSDNEVSFGLLLKDYPMTAAFQNGDERSVILRFNFDKKPVTGRVKY